MAPKSWPKERPCWWTQSRSTASWKGSGRSWRTQCFGRSSSRRDDSGAGTSPGDVARRRPWGCWSGSVPSRERGSGGRPRLHAPPPELNMAAAGTEALPVLVNARHLAGAKTGIEVYMEQLMAALGRTGRIRLTALTWEPLHLGLEGVSEVVAARRPNLRPGSVPATLWKLWFDQWRCLSSVRRSGPVLYHGMDGFLPYSLWKSDRAVA